MMYRELELWRFAAERLAKGEPVMLLVVAESSGSSPGRQGYKMAVGADGGLCGSIGGGLMEVNLVEQSRTLLKKADESASFLKPQVHQRHSPNASGMICSGRQTVIFRMLTSGDRDAVNSAITSLEQNTQPTLSISPSLISVSPEPLAADFKFECSDERDFLYRERLGYKHFLCIVGGGHCALALSELMAKLDFYIRIFDDRPELNTLEKNRFAHEIHIIDNYEQASNVVPDGRNVYVVVMTLGYSSDESVIRSLIDKEFSYFGVLGSEAKMAVLMRTLRNDGLPSDKLDRIYTPIGIPINSRTPEEIAVSIAAEIISVKNS